MSRPRRNHSKNERRQRRRANLSGMERLEPRQLLAAEPLDTLPFGATPLDTGEFLLGKVAVTPVFFSSNGLTDTDTQDWSSETNEQGLDEIDQVMQQLNAGLDWWSDTLDTFDSVHSLEFEIDSTFVDSPFSTRFEPIDRNGADFVQYVTEFIIAQGYGDATSIEDGVRRFNQQQRIDHGTDWALTIFVVDASDDQDQQFAPGAGHRGAFAFAGGLFIVIPSTREADVFAHELGHIFWAMDEYQFGASWTEHRGYYDTQLLNAADNPAFDQPGVDQEISIMRGFTPLEQAFEQNVSPATTLAMVGWQDSDGNGVFDVLDVPLDLQATGYFDSQSSEYHFHGSAAAVPLINQNSSGTQSDITLNRISQIQYRLDGGDWMDAQTPDQQRVDFDITMSITDPFDSIEWRARDASTGVTSPIIAGTSLIPAITRSGVSGLAFVDSDQSGQRAANELVLENTTVVIRHADGSSILHGVVDPDDQPDEFLPEPGTGVSVSVAGDDLFNQVGVFQSADAGDRRVFHNYDPGLNRWSDRWSEETVLSAEFDQSVGTVSLEVIGVQGQGYGRLEAFDSQGELIARVTSQALAPGEVATITVRDPEGRIASVSAHGHAETVIGFGALEFGLSDTIVADATGSWSFQNLADGEYVVELVPERVIHQFANSTYNVEVSDGTSEIIMADAAVVDSIRHNAAQPEDVTETDGVSALDALVVINDLGRNSQRILQPDETDGFKVDVNNDGMVSALDALLVINFLGRQGSEAEAESTNPPASPPASPMLNLAGSNAPAESTDGVGADTYDEGSSIDHQTSQRLGPTNESFQAKKRDFSPNSEVQDDSEPAREESLAEAGGEAIQPVFEEPFDGYTV